MKYLNELTISQPCITVFCSGNSINDISEEDIEYIKSKSFLITVNYAPVKITGHMNIHSDKKVSDFLQKHFSENGGKQGLLLTREKAFTQQNQTFKNDIDYWFDERREGLIGNYTVVWLLELLEKYFSDKKCFIFGLDMNAPDNENAKWYDSSTSFDRDKRGAKYPVQQKLNQCATHIDKHVKNKELFTNCNPNSGYNGFKKIDNWKEVYEEI